MSRPSTRAFRTVVSRVARLSPSFVRVTLAGDELVHVGRAGFDQRLKVLLPQADGTVTDIGLFDEPRPSGRAWYGRWLATPDEERNPLRTYTARALRPGVAELDIDFVVHGTDGPGSAWAGAAAPGDPLVVIGPDARADAAEGGVEWRPGSARRVLLAGDESAAPAIAAIVEQAEAGLAGEAFVEVPTAADALDVGGCCDVTVTWLPRDGAPHGSMLAAAVRAWGRDRGQVTAGARPNGSGRDGTRPTSPGEPGSDELPWVAPTDVAGEEYAWLAGEAGMVRSLRRHLVDQVGMDRAAVAFMGYWRAGRSEGS